MTAKQLFQAGQLREAVQALNAEVRDNPTDAQRRTFLFELLCFAGEYDRAEKQLNVLAQSNKQAELGAVLYYSALHAMRTRQELFDKKDFPQTTGGDEDYAGTLNGKPFEWIVDADPRIGPRLELFAAGAYIWIPFEHIISIELQAPQRLRDLLWAPALVQTGPAFKDKELGEVLIPVIYPSSAKHEDDAVRLGRATAWTQEDGGDPLPLGQKTFLVDGEEFSLLEVRKIEFKTADEQV
ncbi:MAG: type VI secretion system accessory protein TagJ [Bryobacteraceae bacterium]